jgi:UDP-N-acetyl-2-amino-2-deoxyglucuronate dehydrogenase
MSNQTRHAIVGVGVVGEWHTRAIPQAGGILTALCDILPEQAKKVSQQNKLDAPIYADIKQMLAKEKIDIVHICTPSGNHLEPVLSAIEAGKNVICEKPIEIKLDRIDRMLEAADKHKVRLAGIFQNRWNPANRALRDAAAAGRFGKVAWAGSFTPWYRTDQYYRDGGWRGTWKLDGGGAMMNQSIHQVDLLQWIAGPIKQVSAYASSRIHKEIEVEDTLSCSLQFENGAFGSIMGTTAMYPGGALRVEIGGENGMAVSEGGLKTFKFREPHSGDEELLKEAAHFDPGGSSNPQLGQVWMHVQNIKSILSAWGENRDADTSGREARKAIAIILAMYESARKNGEPVKVSVS